MSLRNSMYRSNLVLPSLFWKKQISFIVWKLLEYWSRYLIKNIVLAKKQPEDLIQHISNNSLRLEKINWAFPGWKAEIPHAVVYRVCMLACPCLWRKGGCWVIHMHSQKNYYFSFCIQAKDNLMMMNLSIWFYI